MFGRMFLICLIILIYLDDWPDTKIFSMIRADLRFTKNDYYVINRASINYGGTSRLKFEAVQPVMDERL